MIREIFTNKWIIGAAFGLLIVAAGCYWYYQHTTAPYQQEAAEDEKLLQQREADKVETPTTVDKEVTNTPAEDATPTAKKPINKVTAEVENNTIAEIEQNAKPAATDEVADVSVSPYDFGPYPEIPEDFPYPVEWEFPGSNANHELMARVVIKLWTQGIETMGVTMGDGLVYPNYIDTVYIRWDETTDDDDNHIRYIADLGGYPPACIRIEENNIARLGEEGLMTAIDIPSDVKVILYDEAGINPYTFLNLSNKED